MMKFVNSRPIEDTMIFESCYEAQLRLEPDDKMPILANGIATWLLVDGELAGETYGITPRSLSIVADDEIEDCDPSSDAELYCYSTTIMPKFQGKGLARLLKAYWLGQVAERGFSRVVGHSTSPAIMHINHAFGAKDLASHENWYETSRTATFYEIALDSTKTVQASAGDCGVTAIEHVMRSLGKVSLGRGRMCEIGGATDKDGISHDGLKAVLAASDLRWSEHIGPIQDAPLLSIVNYLWEGDGHYGVLVKKTESDVFIFNPSLGTIDRHTTAEFNDLFSSPRYPPEKWALHVGG